MAEKVALLLSGLPRLWQTALASQIAMFQRHQVDIYFHFWDTIDDGEKQELLALTQPKAFLFETQKDFSAFDHDPSIRPDQINIPSRMASQYYSWKSVADLFRPFKENYRFAMRSRSDLQFVYSIEPALDHLKSNEIVLNWWDEGKLVSDLFALGDVDVMDYYLHLFDYLPRYAPHIEFNAEAMLTRHLEQHPNLLVHTDPMQYFFVRRPHMAGWPIERCMQENPGMNKWLDPATVAAHKAFHKATKGDAGETYIDQFTAIQLRELENKKHVV